MINSSVEPQGFTNGLVVPGQSAPPGATLVALHPVGPQQEDQQQPTIRVGALLAAFRRRWFVAIFLGLLVSATAAATVWHVIPDTYTAFSVLLVDPDSQFLYTSNETRQEAIPLEVYIQTGMVLAKFPFVLTAALRDPAVAQLPTIKEQVDPVKWLEDSLQISSPGDQFIKISLTGSRQQDVAPIVQAVVKAFQTEFVDRRKNDQEGN
ncbi:MAG: hypothetical protein KF861_05560, partial [Planctomycetaceae bacterium]|nr:hypothetical protein [Planctomycetaceae bacterium]